MSNTPYQQRYVKHQARKKEQLMYSKGQPMHMRYVPEVFEVLDRRRSQRVFNNEPITSQEIDQILTAATMSPNSCNRHGVLVRMVSERRSKELLGGLLVGGVGWVHRAHTILLFLADPIAYASPNEKDFMHYCDVGFKAMSMWLVAETLGIGACYINPNLGNRDIFIKEFGLIEDFEDGRHVTRELVFCGALALGRYDVRPEKAERPSIKEILV